MAFDLIAALRKWKRKVAWLQERWRGARREIERLRKEVEQLRRREKQLEQEREQLREENEKLKRQLEEAQRASKRPAAPFSRGTRKQNPKTPGRKSGAGYGQRFSKLAPPQVDEVIVVPPPTRCSCGGALEVERIEPQYQQEIVRRTFWRRFDIPICRCPVCHKRVPGRDPRQTSAALGAAAVQLGPNALALAVQMNKGLGMPHADGPRTASRRAKGRATVARSMGESHRRDGAPNAPTGGNALGPPRFGHQPGRSRYRRASGPRGELSSPAHGRGESPLVV